MSWNPSLAPGELTINPDSLETVIVPRARDLGGFEVRRALPAPGRRMVGPFVFFDQIGPAELLTGQGFDIRPHPHIGLGTVTYLMKGHFQHRDSLGNNQVIQPGEVNWMVAGRGVTHSERSSVETRMHPQSLFGVQTWVALPESHEDMAPGFEHYEKAGLPMLQDGGVSVRLILGRAWGAVAPAHVHSHLFQADVRLQPRAKIPLPIDHEDRGVHVLAGSVMVAGDTFDAGRMMVFRPGDAITLQAGPEGARLIMLGGDTLNGPRFLWWNFVASSKDRIEAAKEAWARGDWQHGQFQLPPGDDAEFIPMPPH